MRHEATMLRDYLVAGVEDPRLNVQSILTRHFLIEALFGERFLGLREAELRFALTLNWLRRLVEEGVSAADLREIHHALGRGADNAEGTEIPHYVQAAFGARNQPVDGIRVPDYFAAMLEADAPGTGPAARFDQGLVLFQQIWSGVLAGETPSPVSVLEPACGSANDYRFLAAYGLARLLDYTGLDLCDKNIENARRWFPQVRFEVGNVLEIAAQDKAYDYGFLHDLCEHLSLEALPVAVAELCRVTRRALCVGFFNMHEEADHVVRPVEGYHWNTLSMERVRDLFASHGGAVRVIHIETFLRWTFRCDQTHNLKAYTLIVEFGG
jgi:SAM-dependent methyltransferase